MGVGKNSHGFYGCRACGDVVQYSNHANSTYYMTCMVFPMNIGPTIASSIPGGRASWIGTYSGKTTINRPRVGYWRAALLITVIDRLASQRDLSIINQSFLNMVLCGIATYRKSSNHRHALPIILIGYT